MFCARMLLPMGLAIAVSAALLACADGTTVEIPTTVGSSGGVGGAGQGGSSGEGGDGSSSKSSATHSSASSTQTATGSTSSGGGDGGAGGGDEGGAGGTSTSTSTSSTGSGEVCDFTSPNECATAESLGGIAGDEDAEPVTLTGTTSKWFKVKIEERDSGFGEEDLSWRVNLVSPAGMDYDLIVHEGPQEGGVDCSGGEYIGSADVTGETAYHGYDDEQGIGGEDDTLWLAIEVRYISGEACTLLDTWTLTIQGHV